MPTEDTTWQAQCQWLSPIGAAAEVNVSRRTIYQMLSDGRLRGYKFGGKNVRIKREDLLALMEMY